MKTAFVVLGMHRSGTSSTAGALALAGAAPPQTLMRPAPDNPKGFWESDVVVALNDRILASHDSSWSDWQALPSCLGVDFAQEAAAVLASEFNDAPVIVLKDPRICRFYPFWREILEGAGYRPAVVVPLRHPAEVARSLNARNQMALEDGAKLWLRHVLEAELSSRSHPRHFMMWPSFLQDWRSQFKLMALRLGVEMHAGSESGVDGFLSSELRRQKADDEDFLPELGQRVFGLLASLATRGEDACVHRVLDHVLAEFERACVRA